MPHSSTGDDDENRHFHYLLAEASGNHELAEALGRLHDRLAHFMVLRGGGESQIRTHAVLVEALRAHDLAAARQAMLDEISATREAVLERVIREEGASWHLSNQ